MELQHKIPTFSITFAQAEKVVCKELLSYLLLEEHRTILRADSNASNLSFDYTQDLDEIREVSHGKADGYVGDSDDDEGDDGEGDDDDDDDEDDDDEDDDDEGDDDEGDDDEGDDDEGDDDEGGDDEGDEGDDKEGALEGPDNEGEQLRRASRSVLDYAVEYWLHHVQGIPEFDADILELCRRLLLDQEYRGNYINFIQRRRNYLPFIKCMPSWNPLFYLLYYGVSWVIEKLLELDNTLIERSSGKFGTPIIMAAQYCASLIPMLLKFKPNVDEKVQGFQLSALQHAIFIGNLEAVEALLGVANMDAQFSFGCIGYGFRNVTALHIAARQARWQFVAKMFAAGTNLEIPDEYGQTAIFKAISSNDLQTVKIVVGAGCNLTVRDFLGKTVLQHALELQNASIIAFLLSIMSNEESTLPLFFELDTLEWAEGELWYGNVKERLAGVNTTLEKPVYLPFAMPHRALGFFKQYIPSSMLERVPNLFSIQEEIRAGECDTLFIKNKNHPEKACVVVEVPGEIRSVLFRVKSADQGKYHTPT